MSTMVTCAKCFEDRSDEDLLDSNGDVVPCRGCGSKSVATSEFDLDTPAPNGADPRLEPSLEARVCGYGPCDEPVMRPDSHAGWYSAYCSRAHASAAKTERGDQPASKPLRKRTPKPAPTPARAPVSDSDLRRRYFDLLMEKATATDQPSDEVLDRIERLLGVLA